VFFVCSMGWAKAGAAAVAASATASVYSEVLMILLSRPNGLSVLR
jgi:hypothetical protein